MAAVFHVRCGLTSSVRWVVEARDSLVTCFVANYQVANGEKTLDWSSDEENGEVIGESNLVKTVKIKRM